MPFPTVLFYMHPLFNDSFAPWNQVLISLVIFNTSQDLYKTTVSWRARFTKTNSVNTDSLLTRFVVFTILWSRLFTYRQSTAYILSSTYRAHNMQLFLNWVQLTFYVCLSYTMLVTHSVIKGFKGWKLYTQAISVEHKEYKFCTQNTSCYWN
jgi:hypothetical protein